MIAGIDYGSKMAGTTVIAFEQDGCIELISSKKNQDADQMILDFVADYKPELIGLDAPLSLPGVYTNREACSDYFYRACDREVSAMSPMFLGGLTARAMKLKSLLKDKTQLIEVYPAMVAKTLNLAEFKYKKKEAEYSKMYRKLEGWLDQNYEFELESSHQFDAILALYISKRFYADEASFVGKEEEGFIYY